jgi:hypothetical protein
MGCEGRVGSGSNSCIGDGEVTEVTLIPLESPAQRPYTSVMRKFSERFGFSPAKKNIQVDDMDGGLRTALWNAFLQVYSELIQTEVWEVGGYGQGRLNPFIRSLWTELFNLPIDRMHPDGSSLLGALRTLFFQAKHHEVYDFIEFFANHFPSSSHNAAFITKCNSVLERELSAYQFVGGLLTPVTSPAEISQIEQALHDSPSPVQEHLRTALELLSKRPKPDCRNSIKESISAVESLCCQLAGKKVTLSEALKMLSAKKKVHIHPALLAGFEKLYAYTSDADGIRHAIFDETNADVHDATFMLVSCSAFINYLRAKAH